VERERDLSRASHAEDHRAVSAYSNALFNREDIGYTDGVREIAKLRTALLASEAQLERLRVAVEAIKADVFSNEGKITGRSQRLGEDALSLTPSSALAQNAPSRATSKYLSRRPGIHLAGLCPPQTHGGEAVRIFAIDPGPEKSAYVIWEPYATSPLGESGMFYNHELKSILRSQSLGDGTILAIEMIACYGMAVGAETFDTCRWVGRFEERWGGPVRLVYRKDVKMHLCHSMRAKDANIRQALIDRHGPVGTKKNPGKLFGISGHLWAALAVADYVEANQL